MFWRCFIMTKIFLTTNIPLLVFFQKTLILVKLLFLYTSDVHWQCWNVSPCKDGDLLNSHESHQYHSVNFVISKIHSAEKQAKFLIYCYFLLVHKHNFFHSSLFFNCRMENPFCYNVEQSCIFIIIINHFYVFHTAINFSGIIYYESQKLYLLHFLGYCTVKKVPNTICINK